MSMLFLAIPLTLFVLFVLPVWLWLHYNNRTASGSLSQNEQQRLLQLTDDAKRMRERIQALEAWAGTDLVDRSSYPTRLTSAGKTMYDQALEMLQSLQSTRSMLRAHSSSDKGMVGFAVPHTLAFTFFPSWVSQVQEQFGSFKSRLIALNVHDAVMRL